MAWLALGLPAHVLVKALSPAFYARENTIAPLLATLKAIAVAIVLGVLLGHWFGTPGIAAAIALGAWSNALSLVRAGAATFGFSIDAAAYHRLPRILASALAMGALLWLATGFLPIAGMQAVAQMIALLMACSSRCLASPPGARWLSRSGKIAPPDLRPPPQNGKRRPPKRRFCGKS